MKTSSSNTSIFVHNRSFEKLVGKFDKFIYIYTISVTYNILLFAREPPLHEILGELHICLCKSFFKHVIFQ